MIMKKPDHQLIVPLHRFKTVLTTLFAAAVFVSSCVKDPVSEPASERNWALTEKDNPYTITQEEALDNMFDMMDRIYGPATRASARAVVSIEPVTLGEGIATRTGSATTTQNLAYVANFANNHGFAVMSADTRVSAPVLCITESGSLSSSVLSEAIDEAIATNSLVVAPPPSDPLPPAGPTNPVWPPDPEEPEDEEYDAVLYKPVTNMSSFVADLLANAISLDVIKSNYLTSTDVSTVPSASAEESPAPAKFTGKRYRTDPHRRGTTIVCTKWSQYDPYNTYTPNKYPAGCWPIAIAQFMAYSQWPDPRRIHNGVTSSWADMRRVVNYATYEWEYNWKLKGHTVNSNPHPFGLPKFYKLRDDLASLISCMGTIRSNLNADYAADGTSVYNYKALSYLRRFFKVDKMGGKYLESAVKRGTEMDLPTIVTGRAKKSRVGHAWLMDGYMIQAWYDRMW